MVGGLVDVAALDLGFSVDLRFSFGVCAGGRDPAPGAAGDVRCRAVRGGGTRAVVSLGEGGRAFPGAVVVIDVRPDERIPPEDAEVFRMTAMACGQAGWEFRRAGTIDPVVRANVRWLSRYRHPRCRREPTATELLEAFTAGRPLLAGAAQVGDPVAVLPVAYHLLWLRELSCDLSCEHERGRGPGGGWRVR